MVNKVILLGRLGQDPELRHTPSGSAVCTFSVATNEVWKDRNSGQKQEKTEWHRVVVWDKRAELCHQYLGKGRQVFLEGKLQTRTWDDQNGNKRYMTEVLAQNIQFIGGRGDEMGEKTPGQFDNNRSSGTSENLGGQGNNFAAQSNSQNNLDQYTAPMDDHFTADDIPF